MTLKDVRFALDGEILNWRFRPAVSSRIWPQVARRPDGSISLRDVHHRFARSGVELRKLANLTSDVWQHVSRLKVVRELHDRIRDPAIMRQNHTDLCGPYSLMFEFARRNPVRYIRGAGELLFSGFFTARNGKAFQAEEDLRGRPVPDGIAHVDWIYAATIRDSENVIDDVDDGEGIEGATWPFELEEWTEAVLGLKANYIPCFSDGELAAIRAGQRAVNRGGVAFLLIDVNLIHDGGDDTEEDMWWRSRFHNAGGNVSGLSELTHSEDDESILTILDVFDPTVTPGHYAVLLGGLQGASSDAPQFRVTLWSFGREYEMQGEPDAFGEYLYAVITGEP